MDDAVYPRDKCTAGTAPNAGPLWIILILAEGHDAITKITSATATGRADDWANKPIEVSLNISKTFMRGL